MPPDGSQSGPQRLPICVDQRTADSAPASSRFGCKGSIVCGRRARKSKGTNARVLARRSRHSSLLTLDDCREMVLSGTSDVGHGNRGIYVDDQRYGRVLISWTAVERVEFGAGGRGRAYGDFFRAARSPAASPRGPDAVLRAGWSTTSTRARRPKHSMPARRVSTPPFPSTSSRPRALGRLRAWRKTRQHGRFASSSAVVKPVQSRFSRRRRSTTSVR
jgi:hypothetical protein